MYHPMMPQKEKYSRLKGSDCEHPCPHMAGDLVSMGLHQEKRLSFYQTTYVRGEHDIDTYKTSTLGEMAGFSDDELKGFIKTGESEIQGFVVTE